MNLSVPGDAPQDAYAVLPGRWAGYPPQAGRSLTCYAPVRRLPGCPSPLDLHVLSTPPAFVLSQDQTLQWMSDCSLERSPWTWSTDRVRNHIISWNCPLPPAPLGQGSSR